MRGLFRPINSGCNIGKYLEKKRDYIKDVVCIKPPYRYIGEYGLDNNGIIRMLEVSTVDFIELSKILIPYINTTTLIELYIHEINIKSSQSIKLIVDLIKNNPDLRVFSFGNNGITSEQFKILIDILKFHKNIEILDLTFNPFEDEGAKYLSEVLLVNNSIRYLELQDNYITIQGAKYLYDAMKINKTLIFIDCRSDPIYHAAELAKNNRKIYKINKKYFLKYLHLICVLKNIHIRNHLYKNLLAYVILTNIINISCFEYKYKKYLLNLL